MPTTPQQHLEGLIATVRAEHNVPALAAALVHGYGAVKVSTAKGLRRADKSAALAANHLQPGDQFHIGSVTKPCTGFLMARLVKLGPGFRWTTRIVDAFPEFASAACRQHYGVRGDYLHVTLEQFMSQQSGMFDQHHETVPEAQARSDPAFVPDPWFIPDPGALQAEWSNAPALLYKRFLYAVLGMQMPPLFPPGQGKGYGGAPMVCAAMAERVFGKTYEALFQEHVLVPGHMTQSRIGRSATADTPDGPFGHDASRVPNEVWVQPQADFNSHAPAGAAAFSHRDLALFLEQNLHARPGTSARLLTDAELDAAQARINTHGEGVTRCGWAYHDDTRGRQLWHSGDDGTSVAGLRLYPDRGFGIVAAATINAAVGDPAVGQALDAMEDMEAHWARLFGA